MFDLIFHWRAIYYGQIYHTVNRLRSFLSLGHLVTWSLGHLVTWSLGHSVTRSLGHSVHVYSRYMCTVALYCLYYTTHYWNTSDSQVESEALR